MKRKWKWKFYFHSIQFIKIAISCATILILVVFVFICFFFSLSFSPFSHHNQSSSLFEIYQFQDKMLEKQFKWCKCVIFFFSSIFFLHFSSFVSFYSVYRVHSHTPFIHIMAIIYCDKFSFSDQNLGCNQKKKEKKYNLKIKRKKNPLLPYTNKLKWLWKLNTNSN